METGQQALVRAGDATAGILAARGSGLTMVTLSQAGQRAMASRGTIRGTRGNQLPNPPQPSWIATMVASTVESAVTSSISRSLREAATSWVQSLLQSCFEWTRYFVAPAGGGFRTTSWPSGRPRCGEGK